jgi:thioredoxin-like negative regulator of GroEL
MESSIPEIHSESELKRLIREKEALLLYVSSPDCNVCKQLKPKINDLIRNELPRIALHYIDAKEYPDLSGPLNVFGFPTLILFFEGKEYIRKSRHFGLQELGEDLTRLYALFFDE